MGVVANLSVKISANMADFEKNISSLSGPLDKMTQAFLKANLIERGTSMLINFGKSAFDMASSVHDSALKLGISAEAAQRFGFAAEQSGASLSTVERSIHFMNKALAEGKTSTIGALTQAGLNFQNIRSMKPEDAFAAIADAVGRIPDPMIRANVAQELFSRGGLQLLPGMIEGWSQLGDQIDIMSTDTVNQLEAAQDAWEAFGTSATIISGNIIAAFMDFGGQTNSATTNLVAGMAGSSLASADFAAKAKMISPAMAEMNQSVRATGPSLHEQAEAMAEAARQAAAHEKAISTLTEKISGAGLAKDVNELSIAYDRMKTSGELNAVQTDRLVQEIERLRAAGAILKPNLLGLYEAHQNSVRIRQQEEALLLLLASRESAYSFILEKTRSVLPQVTAEEQKRMIAAKQAMDLRANELFILDKLQGTTQIVSAEQQAMWSANAESILAYQKPLGQLSGMVKTVADAFTGGFVQILSGAVGFKDGMIRIFSSLWTQILGDITNRFIGGIMNVLTGAQGGFAAAFSGLFGMAKPAAGAAGAASGAAWSSAAMTAIQTAGWAALGAWAGFELYKWFRFGFGSAPRDSFDPEKPSGGGPDYQNPNNPYVDDNGNAYDPGDPNANAPDPNNPQGTTGPDWSHLPGFASGGYGDFGSGTPAMLHGKEYIIPESKMGSGFGGITVNLNLPGAIITDDRGAQRLAEIVSRKLHNVMARYQPA